MAAVETNEFGQPVGPNMSGWVPRIKPPPIVLQGKYCSLEPLDPDRHTHELWQAYSLGDAREWTYLFAEAPPSEEALYQLYSDICKRIDTVPYVIISGSSKTAVGTINYMNMNFQSGDIEIGSINLSLSLKKTSMSTEAIYLMISRAMDDLGYRRMVWKCNSLNEASRRAAKRYGFTFEGIFRNHMILKGRSRDTAWFSITDYEWPERKAAFELWLAPSNFDNSGTQIRSLSEFMPPSSAIF